MEKPSSEISINGRKIGHDYPTYFIADIAANHDGDLNKAKDLIHMVAESGGDIVKFQHFTAKSIVSDYGFRCLGDKQSHQRQWRKSVFDVYDAVSVDINWTIELIETCNKAGIGFFTSPYSLELIEQIDPYVPAYKVGSGDITWDGIIQAMAKKNKPMFIATGASSIDDVCRAVAGCLEINPDLCLMQCNTNYTACKDNFHHIHLNVLNTYRSMFPGMILGLSDHTPGDVTVLGAIALGARVIEKHFTLDNNCEGPDHKFSLTPDAWKKMIERSRDLEASLGIGIKKIEDNEKETVILQRRSLRVKHTLKKGHILINDDLENLRPCPDDAVAPYDIGNVTGKRVTRDICEGDYIRWDMLTD